jgi:hypothetical protein
MTIKLNKEQVDYLDANLFTKKPNFLDKLQRSFRNGYTYLTLDTDVADEIRDWAGDEQQRIGFNVDYELTQIGKLLDELIDIFYIN